MRSQIDENAGSIKEIDETSVFENIYEVMEEYSKKYSVLKFHGIHIDLTRITEKRYTVKKAYQIIESSNTPDNSNAVQTRVHIIGWLENTLRTDFRNTRDFRQKIEKYLAGYDARQLPVTARIKKARKKSRWTQKELANHLGLKSHVPISQYERGLRRPPKKVFKWLKEIGM